MNNSRPISTGNEVGSQGQPRNLLIGIPTFNRRNIVEMTAHSLSMAEGLDSVNILVIDDASTEYTLAELRPLYPVGTQFIRNSEPSGMASKAARSLLENFLARSESTLIILDSDLIVAKDFIARAREMLPRTSGLLSLFHAHTHPWEERDGLLLKQSVGFAGSVWTKPLAHEMLEKVSFSIHFDTGICNFLRHEKREIFSLKDSAVQHIGLVAGENSTFATADFGLSFTDTSWYNSAAIQAVVVQGCQAEFQKAERRHYDAVAELRKKVDELRNELALFESGFAFQRKGGLMAPPSLSLPRRLRISLARLAFRLLRGSQRKPSKAKK